MIAQPAAAIAQMFAVKWHDAEGRTKRSVSIQGPDFVRDLLRLEEVPTGQVQTRYPAHVEGGRPLLTVTPLDLEWRSVTREQAAGEAAKLTGTWWSPIPGGHPLHQESATAYEVAQMVTLLVAEGSPVIITEHVIGLVYMDEPWMWVSDETPDAWNG